MEINRPPAGNKRLFIYCRTCFNWIYYDELYSTPDHKGWRLTKNWIYCPECRAKDKGGKRFLSIDGVWLSEKEYKKLNER